MGSLFSSLNRVAPKVILLLPLAMVSKTTVIMVPVPLADPVRLAISKTTEPLVLSTVGDGKKAPGIKPPSAEEAYCSLAASKFRVILAPLRLGIVATTIFMVA